MDTTAVVEVLFQASMAAADAVDRLEERGPSERPGQYRLDLVADAAALACLTDAGLSVLSEESGLTDGPSPTVAVLDPIDGSTNADRGIPFYSTSICVFDSDGPWVGTVLNHGTGQRFHAIRGDGAWCDGVPVHPSRCETLDRAVLGLSGFSTAELGSWQYRTLGCASLEFCFVANGSLDAFVLGDGITLRPWDYLAGLLVCVEAGAAIAELGGLDPWIATDSPRRPIAACTPDVLGAILSARSVGSSD